MSTMSRIENVVLRPMAATIFNKTFLVRSLFSSPLFQRLARCHRKTFNLRLARMLREIVKPLRLFGAKV